METEWKRNGKKKKQKSSGNKVNWNGVELEWKWNGKFSTEKDNVQWNGNGMEMEWKWNGNELGSGMELVWKWNGNGMKMEIYKKFVIELKME